MTKMENVLETVSNYWLQFSLGLLSGAMLTLWRWCVKWRKEKAAEDAAIRGGVTALLHDAIYSGCYEALERGSVEPQERENLETVYNAYHKLGGNGSGTALWERTKGLKIKEVR